MSVVELASDRGWGSGWPHCDQSKMVAVTVPGTTWRVWVRNEIAPIVAYAMQRTVDVGYGLHDGWCWGFACRPITGTGVPSNHSWGLAVDLNAPANPMTSDGVNHGNMPAPVVAVWKGLGFRWGGDYTGTRKDPMHMEFMGTPADAARLAAGIGTPTPAPPPPATPVPAGIFHRGAPDFGPRLLYQAQPMLHGPDVKTLQDALNFACGQGLVDDGIFGPATATAIRNIQNFGHLTVDGIAGPATKALLGFLFAVKA